MPKTFKRKKTAYCPRCDRAFLGDTKVIAMTAMREHLKKCTPSMLPEVEPTV